MVANAALYRPCGWCGFAATFRDRPRCFSCKRSFGEPAVPRKKGEREQQTQPPWRQALPGGSAWPTPGEGWALQLSKKQKQRLRRQNRANGGQNQQGGASGGQGGQGRAANGGQSGDGQAGNPPATKGPNFAKLLEDIAAAYDTPEEAKESAAYKEIVEKQQAHRQKALENKPCWQRARDLETTIGKKEAQVKSKTTAAESARKQAAELLEKAKAFDAEIARLAVEKAALQAELEGVTASRPPTEQPKEQKERVEEATKKLKGLSLGNPEEQKQIGEVLALLEDAPVAMETGGELEDTRAAKVEGQNNEAEAADKAANALALPASATCASAGEVQTCLRPLLGKELVDDDLLQSMGEALAQKGRLTFTPY